MSIKDLAERLGPLDEMRNTPAARSFTLGVWRALRNQGQPLDQQTLDQLASDAGLTHQQANAITARYAELNQAGQLIGLSGLSIADHPHRITFEDRTLTSWCAWDPFFLVPALGGSATVTSTDPQTGAAIHLTFQSDRVTAASPPATVISIVVPPPRDDGAAEASVEELWASF